MPRRHYRVLGKTGCRVSTISFGAWAIGGGWGGSDDATSLEALHRAVDRGVNFFDTADVYGDGRSERLLARLRQERSEPIVIATKAGRRLSPHVADGYTSENLGAFVERTLRMLDTDALDLVQRHCPPTDVYYRPEVFGAMDRLVEAGKVRHYGVSVERVEEALQAMDDPGVASVQITTTCSGSDRQTCSWPRRRAATWASWRGWPCRRACSPASSPPARRSPRTTSPVQSPRRAVRSRRDVLGPRLRGRARGRGAPPSTRARRPDAGAVRAAVDPDGPRGHLRHSGRAHAGPGGRQHRGSRPAPSRCRDHGSGAPRVRHAGAAARPRTLVTPTRQQDLPKFRRIIRIV